MELAPAAGTRAAVLGMLAFPWAVHAQVVLLSGFGAHPLAGQTGPIAILVLAVWSAGALWSFAVREPVSVAGADAASGMPRLARIAAAALARSALCAWTLGLILAFALPIVAYDALGYRLPVIAQWLDAGRIAWVASDDPVRNGYPLGQEAISAVLVAATGAMRCASATSLVFVSAGALSVAWLARALRVRASLAMMSAGLFVLVPIAILNGPSGYVDAAFAGAVVALLCTATLWWLQPSPWHALAAGMAAAHVLALKGTGIAFVSVAALCLGAGLSWRALTEPQIARTKASARLPAIALAAALPGAFWGLRNVLHTGNPLWPVTVKVAGRTLFHGVASMEDILSAASNTPAELSALGEFARVVRVWLQPHGPALEFDDRLAGLGWAFPFFALPALVACLVAFARRRDGLRGRALAFVVLMTLGCYLLQPLRWWPRYCLWLWGAGALAIALQAEVLLRDGRTRALALGLALLAALSIGEAAVALVHTKGALQAVSARVRNAVTWDLRRAPNAAAWVSPKFWELGIERDADVCRGAWKPATDNANLDGVFAQVVPRPRVHVLPDDDTNWKRLRSAWRRAGCARLLLLHGSPVLSSARRDPAVHVERVVAFDVLFVVGPRSREHTD